MKTVIVKFYILMFFILVGNSVWSQTVQALFDYSFFSSAFLDVSGIIPWMSLISYGLTAPSEHIRGGLCGRYTAEEVLNVPAGSKHVQVSEKNYEPYAVTSTIESIWKRV